MAATRQSESGVFLIADRPICRHGMSVVIDAQPGFTVTGNAASAEEAIEQLRDKSSAIAVIDFSDTGPKTAHAIHTLHLGYPELRILAVGAENDSAGAVGALRAGAKGCIARTEGLEGFIQALVKIVSGQVYLSPVFSEQLITDMARGSGGEPRSALDRLTDREQEVLHLLGAGMSTRQMAEQLHVSVKTIETHRAHIKEKLGLRTAAELLHYAMQRTGGGGK